jgi:hypothetical protein
MNTIIASAGDLNANSDWSGVRPILSISHGVEIALNVAMAVAVVASIYYAIMLVRKEDRLNPIYILIGGTLTVFYEPMGDLGAHVTFHADQINAVAAYGFHVPTWMIGAYTIAVGTSIIWMIDMIRKGLTAKKWWQLYATMVVVAVLFELPLIYLGAIEYYAPQSLSVFGYPIWMAFMNCTGLFFVPATIIYLLSEHGIINKRNAFLLIPLTPLVVAGSHTAADFLRGHVINGPHGQFAIESVSLLSIAAALFLTWICAQVVTRARVPVGSATRPHAGTKAGNQDGRFSEEWPPG